MKKLFLPYIFLFGFLSQAQADECSLLKKQQFFAQFSVHLIANTFDVDDDLILDPPCDLVVSQPQILLSLFKYGHVYFLHFSVFLHFNDTPFLARGPPVLV